MVKTHPFIPSQEGKARAIALLEEPVSIFREARVGFFLALLLLSFNAVAQLNLIPKPQEISKAPGSFEINNETKLFFDDETKSAAIQLQSDIKNDLGFELKLLGPILKGSNISNSIIIGLKNDCPDCLEAYSIKVMSPKFIAVYANSTAGVSRALATLRQLYLLNKKRGVVPAYTIVDSPKFQHRGFLLDCSRHFFSVETVKKYIDLLAFYKMNTLHWHLTEDQGWRIEIDKYPKLTEVGAWRTEKDGSRYGGFYTKEEIREVVAFAAARGVTVIPEIELPGHAQAALAAYPEFSCTGDTTIKVANDWGVFKEIYCAGNDSTFTFLEDVLTEVMELFPSKYIHIGGDEAPKFRWEHCAKCQKRMADLGLKNEHELQSYFITRIEKFLNAHGRELIGWDEILEGGLSPNATVQSWRGMEYGKEAAEQKHNVIMSPTSHCYLDYDLRGINLEKVYSFNPIPEGLEKEFEQYILGGEVNMWTEHVPNDSVLDSKVFPRLIAAAEVFWSGPGGDYPDFYNRLQNHYPLLKSWGVNYGLEAEPVGLKSFVRNDSTFIELIAGSSNLTLEFSYCHAQNSSYKQPFYANCDADILVRALKDGMQYGDTLQVPFSKHLALGKKPNYTNVYSSYYTAGGDFGLVDGLTGTLDFRDGRWQGFSGDNFSVEIDLGKSQQISSVSMNFYEYPNAWIMYPKSVSVQVSEDGEKWEIIPGMMLNSTPENHPSEKETAHVAIPVNATIPVRFVRITALNYGVLPAWHEAAGSDAWIFVDEIIVR